MNNDEDNRHKYDLEKDCEAWEKLHGKHVYVINPPRIPKWLQSKKNEEKNN